MTVTNWELLTTSREERVGCPVETKIRGAIHARTVVDGDTNSRTSVEGRVASSVYASVSTISYVANCTNWDTRVGTR